MNENSEEYDSQYSELKDLTREIAIAVKNWRLADIEVVRLCHKWYHENDLTIKDEIYKTKGLHEAVRDGTSAQIKLLADRFIELTTDKTENTDRL